MPTGKMEYWRTLAREARTNALEMSDPADRRVLEAIAYIYDHWAQRAVGVCEGETQKMTSSVEEIQAMAQAHNGNKKA